MNHILIVDDDELILAMVSFLAKEQSNVRTTQVGTGKEMHAVLSKDKVDLVVLDLGLPDEDGLVLARQVRARSDVPIIVLTGDNSKESLIAALEIGIQDFVTKPFDPYEFRLRIRNQLKYVNPEQRSYRDKEDTLLKFDGYSLDLDSRTLETKHGRKIHLTQNEFCILTALVKNPNKALSRNAILDVIASGADVPSDRAVDVYITQIRKKIEKDPKSPVLITSIRGFGYMLVQTEI